MGNGKIATIQKIGVIDTVAKVYNITVENTHNFFVGKSKVLVHNSCGFTQDQQALIDLANDQLRINESLNGEKALTNGQADDLLDMANKANQGVQYPQKVLDHRFTSGGNPPPGHYNGPGGEGTNGHIHVGNAGKGHVRVNN